MRMSKSVMLLMGRYGDLDPAAGTSEDEQLLRDAMQTCGISPEKV